jgi:hypothetical protein
MAAQAARVLMAAQERPDPVPVHPVMRARPAETAARAVTVELAAQQVSAVD